MLLCTVRECRAPLLRAQNKFVCAQGHSFDIARSGYLNLLQPQERRSKQPGDTKAAIEGRRRLHDRGVTLPLLDAVAALAQIKSDDIVLDVGCGDGFYLGTLQKQFGFDAHGVDISVPAIDAAARRYPACEWVVANADRIVPYADRSFTLVTSITARMNTDEFRRVLREDGRLLVAVPAPDDLMELRGAAERDRVERTITAFAGHFEHVKHVRATTHADLDADAVQDVLHSIYIPKSKLQGAMRLTFSLDLLLFRPRV